jgi:hypothetical protein
MSNLTPKALTVNASELEAVRPVAARADEIAQISDREAFRLNARVWLELIQQMSTSQLIALVAYLAAADDPNRAADRAIPARLKSLREAVISLIQVRTTSELENTIIHLDQSTEKLNKAVFGLSVVGVILTAVQAVPILIGWLK